MPSSSHMNKRLIATTGYAQDTSAYYTVYYSTGRYR